MQALDKYINEIKTLPPAPRVLSQLLLLLNDVDAHADQIVELIAFDPALTAGVLKRCNNAVTGRSVSDLDEAVKQVGFNAIYRLVAMVVGEGLLGSEQRGYGIGRGELWEHSVTTALAARVIARKQNGEENLAFTAGLLHDIGKLVLGTFLEGSRQLVVKGTRQSGQSFLEAEQTILGVEHAEIGGRVLARWNFPENLVSAVWHHHNPVLARPHEQLAAYVHLGDIIAHCLGQAQGFESFALRPQPSALEILKISPDGIDTLVLETDEALNQCNGLIKKAG
ncbi:MAG: HDOD domain-containing protein [Verrucomicrobiota bacterium]|jgi:putative nucleotidyltransferase with HDIG domain